MRRSLVLAIALLLALAAAAPAADECDGLPRLSVETPAGFCVGIVATGFRFPRAVAVLQDGTLLVADMGGWAQNRGAVWRLTPGVDGASKEMLFDKVDRPASIALGPDGKVYVGTPAAIFRFAPDRPKETWSAVVDGLPVGGLHPLTVFTFDAAGALYVNVGSVTDNCAGSAGKPTCDELEAGRGVIRRYAPDGRGGYAAPAVFARGLRNTMGMAFVDARLYAVENSRDRIHRQDSRLDDEELPHDELNIIEEGKHYGWPFCYDAQHNAPEFPAYDCKTTQAPHALLPAHAAPLGLLRYTATRFPAAYRGKLLMAYHGYRKYGHRIVLSGFERSALPLDVVRGWTKERVGTQGAPVGLALAPDGAVYIADDRNKSVLRLTYDAKGGDGTPLAGAIVPRRRP